MLILSRQRDETIMIGDEIEIMVVDIRGDKVRLGITRTNKDRGSPQGGVRCNQARE